MFHFHQIVRSLSRYVSIWPFIRVNFTFFKVYIHKGSESSTPILFIIIMNKYHN